MKKYKQLNVNILFFRANDYIKMCYNITDEQIKRIENWINNRSMKILGWKSPNELFESVAL